MKQINAQTLNPHRIHLRADSILLNDRNGMDKEFIHMPEVLRAKMSASRILPEGITNLKSHHLQKKNNRIPAGSSQVYLIDTVVVYSIPEMVQSIHSYNAQGKTILSSTSDTLQYIYSYNAGGKVVLSLAKEWQNGQLINSMQDVYSYDAKGNQLSKISQQWYNGQWTNYILDSCTYDAKGRQLTYLIQEWDGQSMDEYSVRFISL